MVEERRVAVVTGANRGIGLEASRQLVAAGLRVVMTCRDVEAGREAASSLGLAVDVQRLDVTDAPSVAELAAWLEEEVGRLDVLVNNAGVASEAFGESVFDTDVEDARRDFEVNALGPLRVCQGLLPLMRRGGYGRVVNVSTGMAQLQDMNGGAVGYRMSKTALNALTRVLADELEGENVKVNAVCPGWVRTAMGGEGAERPVDEAVDTILWLSTLRDDGPSGGFFRDCKTLAW